MRPLILLFIISFSLLACAKKTINVGEEEITVDTSTILDTDTTITENSNPMEGTMITNQDSQAVVTSVNVSGSEDNYTFSVSLKSPDTGCDQFADWWEVFDKEEQLIYRRILLHSHVNEQPFTRSGGAVNIKADTFVYIRGHMNKMGYGSLVFGGTVKDGFEAMELPIEFAANLAGIAPLPTGCSF